MSMIPLAKGLRAGAVGLICALFLSGCADPLAVFDDEFLTALSLGPSAASIPGDAPALLVEVENRTSRRVEAQISWRTGDGEARFEVFGLSPDDKSTEVLICPVDEITLGDVGDLTQPGAFIRLGGGGVNDPFIEVEAFGVLLKEGANYSCGDTVTFTKRSDRKEFTDSVTGHSISWLFQPLLHPAWKLLQCAACPRSSAG